MWEIIESLLKSRKMNIHTLAKAAEIPPTTIYSWKSGKASPTAEKLAKIAKALNVNSEYLMGRTSDPTPIKNLQEEIQKAIEKNLHSEDADYRNLYDIYSTLTDENKHALFEFANFLLSRQK